MQKCSDSNFCTRLRSKPGPAYEVAPSSISLQGSAVSLTLTDPDSKSELSLAVTAYDGVLRFRVTEPSQERFEVPDVLQSSAISRTAQWRSSNKAAKLLSLQIGTAALAIHYKPFWISITVQGSEVVQLNSKALFNFEPLRQKQVQP